MKNTNPPFQFFTKLLLTVFALGLFFSQTALSQTDTPCECAKRWTKGATWNPNGTINDAPNAPPPNGIIRCGSSAETQSQIEPGTCTYNPSQFIVDVSVLECIDPSTGLPIIIQNPTAGQPIIWLNFDVRPYAGNFQIQINDNAGDNIGWALYASEAHMTGTSTAPPNQTGLPLSGDCSDLTLISCGSESSASWNTIPVYGEDFTQATNLYLAVWDQNADGEVKLNNFKARYGCGDTPDQILCSLDTGTPTTTCNPNGTYTLNIPISGVNAQFIAEDAAAGVTSNTVCLTNLGSTGVVTGTLTLIYPQYTDYNVTIHTVIPSTIGCAEPDNPNDCEAIVSGLAPNCCIPPNASATGGTITCTNLAVQLNGASTTPGVTYEWTGPNGYSSNLEDPIVTNPGTYTLKVCQGNDPLCCTTVTADVNEDNDPPTAIANGNDIPCFGETTTLDGTGSSVGPDISYLWTTSDGNILSGETSLMPVVDVAGTYVLTVTNSANGCTATASATISEPPPLLVATAFTDVSCFGGSDGSIDLGVAGGTPAYTYSWSNGATTEDLTGLTAGTYTVTVTDANYCTATTSATVHQPPALVLSTSVTNVPCSGGNNGAVDLAVSGGTPGYTYLWSTGATSQDLTGLTAGTYTVTVTDANGCTATTSATVNQASALVLTTAVTDVTCFGGSNGAINLTASGGTPPIGFLWSNGATTEDLTGLTAGTYTVTVTDANYCTATTSATVHQPPALVLSTSVTNVPCSGGNNGAVDLAVSGGTPGYTYLWSTGATSQDLTGLTAGTYTVTVTDANGCTATTSATVNQASALVLTTAVTDVTCFGGSNGAINLTASGGTPPIGFLWSNGATTEDLTGLTAGTYTVTVTDANYCTATTSATVHQPPALALSTSVTNVPCSGGSNGAVDLTVSGGTPGYTYLWSTGATSQDLTGLTAGTYTVTVTDANGCTATTSATVNQASALVLTTAVTDVTCFGGSNGAINLTASGGTPPIGFLWSNGATTEDLTGLTAGTYTVTVTDANYCTATTSATVHQPPALALSTSVTNVPCSGGSNGAVDLTVSGGTPGYTYLWSTGATSQDLTGLTAGTYTVTVTDANGCTATTSATVNQASALVLTTAVTDVTCFGGSNGAINLTASGGTPPIGFLWSNGATTEDLTGLTAGTYTVTVTDANYCTATTSATVHQPPALALSTSVTNVPCSGGSNGAVDLTVSGGTPGYTYLWSTGATSQDLTGLTAGTYTVTVTDANGCTATTSATVNQASALVLTTAVTDVTCFGGSNGAINLTASGGTPPIGFLWSNGATTEDLTGLTAGTYTVTVTDANGCTATTSATVHQPTALALSTSVTNVPCSGGSNGAVDLAVSGGTPGYTYLWSNGATSQDLTGLTAGTYIVTVTDANGCTATTSATVNQASALVLTTAVTDVTCFGGSNGAINLTASGGTPPIGFLWSNGATTEDLTGLTAGTYTVTVTDANYCTATTSATVHQPTALALSTSVTNVPCSGGSNGAVDLTVSGGTPGYTYLWSTGATSQDLTGLTAGTYTVTVTDANGCTATTSATVNQASALVLTTAVTDVTCFGGSNGAINLTASGGTPPIGFLWSNGATTEDLTGLTAGTYTVTVTDANGCTATTSATVHQPTALALSTSVTNVPCSGGSNGAVDLAVSGGTPGYTYLWSNGATSQDLTGLTAGTYIVTVTDANGCTATTSATVNQASALVLTTAVTDVTCFGGSNGAINLTASGGTPPIGFLWSNGATTEDLTGLTAGTYTVTVTDANYCTATTSATVHQPTALALSTSVTNVPCSGGSNGAVDLTVSGGTPGYTYLWSNGATSQDLTGLTAGTYIVTVTDVNGCTGTKSATITATAAPMLDIKVTNVLCHGGSTGSIDLTVTGGTPAYTYLWSNGATTQDLNNLAAGIYTVTVTDASGCSVIGSATVNQPPKLTLSISATNLPCEGGNTGSINLTVNGGTPAFTFLWSNGATTEDLSNIGSGTYFVTVTDSKGCTAVTSATVSQGSNVTYGGIIGFGNNCLPSATVCNTPAPLIQNCASPTGGTGALEVIWLKAINNPTCIPPSTTVANIANDPYWSLIPGANGLTLDPGLVTQKTCYLRCVRRAGCETYVESNIIYVDISPNCGGGTPDCNAIIIASSGNSINMSGLTAPIMIIKVFNSNWQTVFQCTANCPGPTLSVDNLPVGTYYVTINFYTASWNPICEKSQYVTVSGGPALPSLSINDVTVNEGAGTVTLQVCLSAASASQVTVNYATSNGTAISGSDYTAVSGTLTFPAGTVCKNISVNIINDTAVEPTESFNVNLSNPSGATIADGLGVVTILDNDTAPVPTLSINDVTVSEGSGTATLQVCLSAASASQVTVSYATSNGTASAGSDYTAVSGTLTFSAGTVCKNISVNIINDTAVEPTESFNVNLSNPSGATIADGLGVVTILDNDTAPVPTLSINDVTVSEGAGTATLQVCLSAASASQVTVSYATSNGTASAGSDYTAVSGTLTFPAGTVCKNISVNIINDTAVEPTESFNVNLSNPSGATIADGLGVVTILDNDTAPVPTLSINDVTVSEGAGTATLQVCLSAASASQVTVSYATSNGTASARSDYTAVSGTLTFSAGTVCKNISVSISDDTAVEPTESFNVNLSNPSGATIADGLGVVTILDNDNATPDCNNIVITNGGNSITASGLTAPVVMVQVFNDPSWQTVFSCSGNCSVPTQVVNNLNPGLYHVRVTFLTANWQQICVKNQDITVTGGGGNMPTMTINDVSVNENVGTATLQVCLSASTNVLVSVNYATSNGTAAAGSDYTSASGVATIPAGNTCANISIPILDNTVSESTETFNVNLSNAVNATIADNLGVVTIIDNDGGGGIPDCNNITVTGGVGHITVTGVNGAPVTSIQVFTSNWQPVYTCFANCQSPTATIPLNAGSYIVYVKYYDANYVLLCQKTEMNVSVAQALLAADSLFSFDLYQTQDFVNLYWVTNLSYRVHHFEVERSGDGVAFEPLMERASELTNNTELYEDYDMAPMTGDNFYRVKMVNLDGSVRYSAVRKAYIQDRDDFLLFPNPANRYVNINLEPIIGKEADIYIYNNMGIQVKAIRLDEVTERTYTINLKELNEGFYHLWIVSPGRKAAVRKLMVGKL